MLKFGMHVLKVISNMNGICEFVLYDWGKRREVLNEILTRLIANESSRFSIGQYTVGTMLKTLPCIHLSSSSEY